MLALLRSWRPPRVQVERPINPGCTKKKKRKFQFQLLLHRLLTFWSEITHIITQNMQAFAAYPQGNGWRWGGAPQILKVRGNTTLSEQQAFPVKSRQQCEYSVAAACSLASLVFHPRRPRPSHEGPLDVCLTAWTLCLCDGRGLKDDGRWQIFPLSLSLFTDVILAAMTRTRLQALHDPKYFFRLISCNLFPKYCRVALH